MELYLIDFLHAINQSNPLPIFHPIKNHFCKWSFQTNPTNQLQPSQSKCFYFWCTMWTRPIWWGYAIYINNSPTIVLLHCFNTPRQSFYETWYLWNIFVPFSRWIVGRFYFNDMLKSGFYCSYVRQISEVISSCVSRIPLIHPYAMSSHSIVDLEVSEHLLEKDEHQNSGNLQHIIGFQEIFDVRPFQGDVLKLQDPLLSD